MKKRLLIALAFILSLFIATPVFCQKECTDYAGKNCGIYGKPFRYSGQTKNALFELGQKSQFKITVYDGFEYRISLCADKNLKEIHFKIREDNTTKTVLYDSSVEEESYLEKMFYVKTTKNLFIEVIVPEGDDPIEDQSYKKRFGCVGVLIEFDRRAGMGFE